MKKQKSTDFALKSVKGKEVEYLNLIGARARLERSSRGRRAVFHLWVPDTDDPLVHEALRVILDGSNAKIVIHDIEEYGIS